MYGIIDIGSNTMRLSCYRVSNREIHYVFHKKAMAGLAGYVNKKNCLTQKGIAKAVEILLDFQNIIQSIGLDALYVIATASFRNVNNTDEILQTILDRTGIAVTVLSGEEEAMYDFQAAVTQTSLNQGLVVDIGGGSTEIIPFHDGQTMAAVSVPIGSLNTFSKYVKMILPDQKEVNEIKAAVKEKISSMKLKKYDSMIGVGGTNRACLKLYRDYYDLKGNVIVMERPKIKVLLDELLKGDKKEINRILKIVPDRIHTIIPGMLILNEIMKASDCKSVAISNWGVREGYLIDQLFESNDTNSGTYE